MAADQAARLRLLVQHAPQPGTHPTWLVITSSRSGCGVTTLTAQLALVLQRRGVRLTVVDASYRSQEPQPANLTELWGKSGQPGLGEWLTGSRPLGELLARVTDNLNFLPLGNPSCWRRRENVLNQNLAKLVDVWTDNAGAPEAVIVDLGVARPLWHESLWRKVHERILVATPDRDVLLDTYALVKRIPELPDAAVRLLINRATDGQQAQTIFQGLVQVCRRFLGRHVGCDGWLPDDMSLAGNLANWTTPAGPFGRAMECLAVQWLNRLQAAKIRTGPGQGEKGAMADHIVGSKAGAD